MLNQGTKAIVHNAWVIIKIHALFCYYAFKRQISKVFANFLFKFQYISSKNNVVVLRVLGIVQKQYKDRIKSLHLNSTIDQK
jgi:hypothetical protein